MRNRGALCRGKNPCAIRRFAPRPRPVVRVDWTTVSLSNFFSYSDPWFLHWALLLLRVFLGVCFVVHGLGKLGLVGPGNMSGFTSWLQSLGFPLPALQARAAMLTELVGGSLIAC